MFVTSRPGTDGGSVASGSGAGGSTSRRMKHGSASLAEKLLSSISPNAEARQNDNRAIQRLYLQQIQLQNDALRQEVTNLQERLQTTLRELNRAERRANKLDMRLELLELMGKRSGRSSHRRHKRSLTSSSGSASSSHHPRSPSHSVLKGKQRRVDPPLILERLEKGKGKMVYQEDEGAAASLMMSQSGTSGNPRATTPDEWPASSNE
ncbi:hypothetical protein EDB84DRAFT_1440530 [Lactarius hengduanensis]|nr:hypothetical protein EDB84DRAFT_1440530 [Lactarius hengduanensis]